MVTESGASRRFANLQTNAGFEPLAIVVDQGDQGNGYLEIGRCHRNDAIEALLRGGSQYGVISKSSLT